MCLGANMCGHKRVWAQINVPGNKRLWAKTCLGTNVCVHISVWAQTCLGTIMSEHNRVGSSMYGHKDLVSVIEWPSRSADLNPIENLWGIMVNEWADRNERTPDMLERYYMEVWECIRRDPELCQQLVQSMRRRMQDCIDNNGAYTKY